MHRVKLGRAGFSNLTHCGKRDVGMMGVVLHPMDEQFGDIRRCPNCKKKVRLVILEGNDGKRKGIVDDELEPQEVQSVTEQFSHWKASTLESLHTVEPVQ